MARADYSCGDYSPELSEILKSLGMIDCDGKPFPVGMLEKRWKPEIVAKLDERIECVLGGDAENNFTNLVVQLNDSSTLPYTPVL